MFVKRCAILISLTAALLMSSQIRADEPSSSEAKEFAVELTADSFDKAIEQNNHFVMFFAPWCGHCKRLHPLWEQLAELMNVKDEPKVIIAKVDCTQQQTLCGTHEVTGYPTLRFFKLGEKESVKFKGTRDLPAITEFISQQLSSDEQENEITNDADEALPVDFAEAVKSPLVQLTEETFAPYVSKGNHFVKFYAPWCSHCQRLAPTWEELAQKLENNDAVSIAKIDCTVYRPICQDFEVKGYPTLLWIEDGKKIDKYSGSRDLDTLHDYVLKMLGEGKKTVQDVQEEQQNEQDKVGVIQLNAGAFENTIKEGVIFVKFYAPWCGHCQKLSPTWDQLAEKYHSANNGVKIAKVDCTLEENKNLCSEQQVEGYPTLFAYKNGAKQPEYDGSRSLQELERYINKLFGHDEL